MLLAAAAVAVALMPTPGWLHHHTWVHGRVSTYGGTHDHSDNNRPALPGATNRTPGIATYNRHTLGGWWLVIYHGHKVTIQQTDLGPAPWTGRVIDFNPPAARRVHGVITDTRGKAVFLSHNRATAIRRARQAKPHL